MEHFDEVRRYSRQIVLPEVGVAGQQRLAAARVLVIGAGGLGSPALLYLAGAGVGTIGIVDDDLIDLSNLPRQVIHDSSAIGSSKVESAAARIAALNPLVEVRRHELRLAPDNARQIIRDYDLVIDGSDNFPTRYLVNDACVMEDKPLVFGALSRYDGQISVLVSGELPRLGEAHAAAGASGVKPSAGTKPPCYRCLFPQPPPPGSVPSCAEAGVLGPLPGVVGALLASEALKSILRLGEPLLGRLLLVDLFGASTATIEIRRDQGCKVCGADPSITRLIEDYEAYCAAPSN